MMTTLSLRRFSLPALLALAVTGCASAPPFERVPTGVDIQQFRAKHQQPLDESASNAMESAYLAVLQPDFMPDARAAEFARRLNAARERVYPGATGQVTVQVVKAGAGWNASAGAGAAGQCVGRTALIRATELDHADGRLAAVIAHEIGHAVVLNRCAYNHAGAAGELAADAVASRLLAEAGFDPEVLARDNAERCDDALHPRDRRVAQAAEFAQQLKTEPRGIHAD